MNMKKTKAAAIILLALATVFLSGISAAAKAVVDTYAAVSLPEDVKVSSRLLEFLFGKDGKRSKESTPNDDVCSALCPGGDIFGMRIKEGRVTVINSSADGVLAGDILLTVNGKAVKVKTARPHSGDGNTASAPDLK